MWRGWLVVVGLGGCRIGFGVLPLPTDSAPDAELIDDAAGADSVSIGCPANYVQLDMGPSRYRALDNSMTWLTSEQMCEADGNHLVIPDTGPELMIVASYLATQNIWTGVTDRKTIGTFLKVTGGPATYLPWDSGEPDATALECAYIDALTITLADQDCTSGRRGVCECDGAAADPATY